jgi:hypothetical protein
MGRKKITAAPVPVEYIRECFACRQDGQLIWRERPRDHFPHRADDTARFNNQRAGSEAGFRGPNGRLMVRIQFEERTRRIAASRVAWVLATGQWPSGPVLPRNGVDDDLRFENLIGHQGGSASV